MNIILASESFIIRESLEKLFQEISYNPQVLIVDDLNKIDIDEIIDLDFIFTEIKNDWKKQLNVLAEAKYTFKNLRIMILDRNNNKNMFEKAIDLGIEGYILGITDRDEFLFNLNKVLQGKKVYEAQLLENVLIQNNNIYRTKLTKREFDVLKQVAKGFSNNQISKNLFITEYTVKKHVSSILQKLGLKNRQEIILYVTKNSI